jgi:hypothetical protein
LTFSLKRPATIFIASYDDCWLWDSPKYRDLSRVIYCPL